MGDALHGGLLESHNGRERKISNRCGEHSDRAGDTQLGASAAGSAVQYYMVVSANL